MNNFKFHLTVIICIIVTVTGVFMVTGRLNKPEPRPNIMPQPGEPSIISHYSITVWEATWGENCTSAINRVRERMQRDPNWLNASDEDRAPLPSIPQRNNAKAVVAEACDGKKQCEFTANDALFSTGFSRICDATINITYRCYQVDRPRTIEQRYGRPAVLDCTDEALQVN